ncbi:MAG TPA: Gfo/Idh/MocA family oxidoreductase [bacterium]|nr:Gfo/Idh/MocA family oxidoreductase [bacterium]
MEKKRRDFLKSSAGVAAGMAVLGACKTTSQMVAPTGRWKGANERIRMACIGIRGQGRGHIKGFEELDDVEVVTLCDIDENILMERAKSFEETYKRKPKTEWDMRKVFEDPSIDAVSFATPNHWHALGTIWACQAGKDVYVEKPASHNVWEGRKMVEASRKYERIVQYGVQLRSSPAIQEAVQLMRDGEIGEVYMARGLCYRNRPTIGHKDESPIPAGVHYDMWLGPAPLRPFTENRFHYNWHYSWDYGNGDLGNQGVHEMDMCMWGLGVGMPTEICTMAGMYIWTDDDKEIPNVSISGFRYPKENKQIVFDVRPWITNQEEGTGVGNLFYGSKGMLVIRGYGEYEFFMGEKGESGKKRNEGGDHKANFIKAVRSRKREDQNGDILQGHYSAALCHLGMIAHRVKRQLVFDPEKEQIVGDSEANKLLRRKYRKPYVIPDEV